MCGRFALTVPFSEIVRLYNLTSGPALNIRANYNVAPTHDIPAVRFDPEAKTRTISNLRWGLVPFWAKDTKVGYSLINAMAETVAEKPSFREAFRKRRCLIPANAFYEWQKMNSRTKQPYAIVMKDRSVFSFAGLWEHWKDKASGETVLSCTIITCPPNAVSARIHNRMPVILDPADYGRWLGEEPTNQQEVLSLLRPYPADRMEAYPVGEAVGNVKNNDASLLEPMAAK